MGSVIYCFSLESLIMFAFDVIRTKAARVYEASENLTLILHDIYDLITEIR